MLRWGPGIYPTCVAAVSVRGSRSWLRRQFPAKSTYVRRSDVQGTPNHRRISTRISTPRGRASRVRAYINECTYVIHTTPGPFVAARGKTATGGRRHAPGLLKPLSRLPPPGRHGSKGGPTVPLLEKSRDAAVLACFDACWPVAPQEQRARGTQGRHFQGDRALNRTYWAGT